MPQCRYSSLLDQWSCPEESITGYDLCIFHDPRLDKNVTILKARFDARLADEEEELFRLDGSIFPEGISFQKIIFERSVEFYGAQFHAQMTSFWTSRFHGETSFRAAQFHGETTSFGGTHFLGKNTVFDGAQFHGQETFFGTTRFHGEKTSFSQVEFSSKTTGFWETEFRSKTTSFSAAKFNGRTFFRGLEPKQVFLEGNTDFIESSVAEEGTLTFDWVDLSRVQFLHTNLSRVRFLNVTWDHSVSWNVGPLQWGGWRSRVYDEAMWRSRRRNPKKRLLVDTQYLPHLDRIYRALKAYYRESGEHYLVGHFHYGLMEVRWYQKETDRVETADSRREGSWSWLRRKLRRWFSWEAAYRFSSGYAEDYAWAGLILVGLVIVFAGCYWWLGVPKEMLSAPGWKQPLHALLYSFQAGTLGRVNFYTEEVRLAARYLHLFESVLIPVQFGFFIFALRNRFRR